VSTSSSEEKKREGERERGTDGRRVKIIERATRVTRARARAQVSADGNEIRFRESQRVPRVLHAHSTHYGTLR